MSRIRNACITSFADTITFDESQVCYLIYHREVCPDTRKLHYHIYVEFKTSIRMPQIKKCFADNSIHIEPRRGSQKQAIAYVLKDENDFQPFEFGTKKKQGERNDIKNAVAMVKSGATNLDIIEQSPAVFVKFNRGLEKVRFEFNKVKAQQFRTLKVYALCGSAGTGKSRYPFDLYGYENVYKLDSGNGIWFDGYEGQDILLIDDFYGWIKYGLFLNILDGYPLRLELKGGHTWANWTKVYITSNSPPNMWYDKGLTPALSRRISYVEITD